MTDRPQIDWPELRLPPVNLWSVPRQFFNTEREPMANATATIKKVSGYLAPDGTHHPSAKAAAEYVQQQTVQKSIEEAFGDDCLEALNDVQRAEQGVTTTS